MERPTSILLLIVLLIGLATFLPIQIVKSSPTTWIVPDDFLTIQEAVDNASAGDTIYVRSGNYTENVLVNKTLTLLGENRSSFIYGRINVEDASDVWIEGFTVRLGEGIKLLESAYNATVTDNLLLGNDFGIIVRGSSCTISSNNVTRSTWDGIAISNSSSNTIRDNDSSDNGQSGIIIGHSANFNLIFHNNFTENDNQGIFINYNSSYNIVYRNNISGNGLSGINLYSHANYNAFYNNELRGNSIYGVFPYEAYFNRFFHNNFIDNLDRQANEYGVNYWDNWEEGNYWSDYSGKDWFKGEKQNETGSDGIGDNPYVDRDVVDNFPLMKPFPWGQHDLGLTRVESPSVIGQGYDLKVTVTLFNYGSNTENYNVTTYANSTIIGSSETGILTSKNYTALSFTLNTIGLTLGTVLELSATVDSVLGEVDTGDNVLVFGWVLVTIVGDVDGNGEVNIFDIVNIALTYGSVSGMPEYGIPEYDINCDLDGDGDVDIFDIVIAAGNYGEQY